MAPVAAPPRQPGAAAHAAGVCGRLLRRLAALALSLLVLVGAGAGLLAWRLAQGPIDVPWLARRIEDAANRGTDGPRVQVGAARIAWEGFADALDRPIDVRVVGIVARDGGGRVVADIPEAALSLSVPGLLRGEVVARAVEIQGARMRILREQDGSLALDLGGASTATAAEAEPDIPRAAWTQQLLDALAAPEGTAGPEGALRRLRVRNAALVVVDRALGATWQVPQADLDLRRTSDGVMATASLTLVLGAEQARIAASGVWRPRGTRLDVSFSPVAPAALSLAAPALASLAPLAAPIGGRMALLLDPQFMPVSATAELQAGAGALLVQGTRLPIAGAVLRAEASDGVITLNGLDLTLAAEAGAPGPTLRATGRLTQDAGRLLGTLSVVVPPLDIARLPALWPPGIEPNTREWLTTNVTAGRLTGGTLDLSMEGAPDLSSVTLRDLSGRIAAEAATVHWLRPVPPLVGVSAEARFAPDRITIATSGGRQGGLAATDGTVTITGLDQPVQMLALDVGIGGTLPDLITVLRHPRLKLFERRPLDLRDPAGRMTGRLAVRLPLLAELPMDDVDITASARLTDMRLGAALAGQDLTRGALDIEVTQERLRVSGTATVAGVALRIAHTEQLTRLEPQQVQVEQTIAGRVEWRQLAGLGLDAGPVLGGAAGIEARLQRRRNGNAEVALRADLRESALAVVPLGWSKPAGRPATASATLRLARDRPTGIEAVRVSGEGIELRGAVAMADGRPTRIELTELALGNTRAAGEIRLPAGAQPAIVTLRGAVLDLAPRMAAGPAPAGGTTPAVRVEAGFGRVILGPGRELAAVTAMLTHDGRRVSHLQMHGRAGGGFTARIEPAGAGRSLTATAADAGALLRALDVTSGMRDGALSLTAAFDDSGPAPILSGTAEVADFRMTNAPAVGRLLQGLTLYGLLETAQGPGLGFSRLIAPFSLADGVLELRDARAFSASLGLTARGRIGLATRQADLQGTVVPAYMFNSLLGNIPLLGRVFSAERGGGLFAATFSIRGPLDDPQVSVNPLSALTPGFLRGLFQLPSGTPGAAPPPDPPNAQN